MKILRGNFEVSKPVDVNPQELTLQDEFEREALKRLGGSIAFVSKKRFLWTGEKPAGPTQGGSEDK